MRPTVPAVNLITRVFGLRSADFTGSPTRWVFED